MKVVVLAAAAAAGLPAASLAATDPLLDLISTNQGCTSVKALFDGSLLTYSTAVPRFPHRLGLHYVQSSQPHDLGPRSRKP